MCVWEGGAIPVCRYPLVQVFNWRNLFKAVNIFWCREVLNRKSRNKSMKIFFITVLSRTKSGLAPLSIPSSSSQSSSLQWAFTIKDYNIVFTSRFQNTQKTEKITSRSFLLSFFVKSVPRRVPRRPCSPSLTLSKLELISQSSWSNRMAQSASDIYINCV